jgi:hypothetical protein
VSRILAPVLSVMRTLPRLCADNHSVRDHLISAWGSTDNGGDAVADCVSFILCDYFKHGFDGSGSDGGSCIDGRLTSSWNWCEKLQKKPYYHVFRLCGFSSFDGKW